MFKDRDVVCFLGDSITAAGYWMAEVYQVLRKKYKIKCYNCGVPGTVTGKALKYMSSECLIYNPDYVSVMFGINDIDITLYEEDKKCLSDIREKKQAAIDLYVKNYRNILNQIVSSGAKPIICIPIPYDYVSDVEKTNIPCQEGLDRLEPYLRELSKEYNCPLVDLKTSFTKFLGQKDIMCPDRVHPTPKGHHIMAQTYLCEIGESEKCDYETPFAFEQWNKKRFDVEQSVRSTNFVEFCMIFDDGWAKDATFEEKKLRAQKLYDETENKEFGKEFLSYIENCEKRDKIRGEIVRLTVF